jgi:kynurenine formamidase
VAPSERFTEIGSKVRNWGRWGNDDQLGTLNLIDDAARVRAAGCIRTGRAIALGYPLSESRGLQAGIIPGRINPLRTMTHLNTPLSEDPDWIASSEDLLVMGTQAATHWDGLAHVSYGGYIYNGHPASAVSAAGAGRCGIHLVRTLVTRGVLLDVALAKGLRMLEPGYAIQPGDLDAACSLARVSVEPGDVVLVRTGQMAHLRPGPGRDLMKYAFPSPGLTMATAPWFRSHDVAAVATDTLPLEVFPGEEEGTFLPVHLLHLVEMGLTQGQNWVLDALAEDCAADGVYEFFLDATPMPLVEGTGSPVNPVAIK